MIKILNEKRVFDQYFKIDEARIRHISENGKISEFTRMKLERKNASAVFIYNSDNDTVVVTKQFRYAIADKIEDLILEIPAGYVDEEEHPLDTALREAEEETGYRIKRENIRQTAEFFVSPGYSTEKIFLFHAFVKSTDKSGTGGGIRNENEYLETIEIPYTEFKLSLSKGKIRDSKTLIGGLIAQLYFPPPKANTEKAPWL